MQTPKQLKKRSKIKKELSKKNLQEMRILLDMLTMKKCWIILGTYVNEKLGF